MKTLLDFWNDHRILVVAVAAMGVVALLASATVDRGSSARATYEPLTSPCSIIDDTCERLFEEFRKNIHEEELSAGQVSATQDCLNHVRDWVPPSLMKIEGEYGEIMYDVESCMLDRGLDPETGEWMES